MKATFSKIFKKALIIAFMAASSITATSCLEEIVPERTIVERGSFGTELFEILAKNTKNSPVYGDDAHVQTFYNYREQFIEAADMTVREEDLSNLNQVFRDIVPLYENMLYPGTLRKAATVIDIWRKDPDAVEALAYFLGSPKLLKNSEWANPIERVFSYEDVAGITKQLLDMALKQSSGEKNATNQLVKALTIEMSDLSYDSESSSILYRAFDLLTREDEIYAPKGPYEPQEAVHIDSRGWPEINPLGGSQAYTPFTDSNSDGFADGNIYGYYTLQGGTRISPFETTEGASAYFTVNEKGHLITRNTHEVFSYFDLQKTPLAYLIREADTLLIDNTLDDLLRATKTLLGEGQNYSDENGNYIGFSKTSGIAQLIAALFETLNHDSVGPNFEAIVTLLKDHPNEVAKLVNDVDKITDFADSIDMNMSSDSDLIDVLLPMVQELAEDPGFIKDLVTALNDPLTEKLGPVISELLERQKLLITYNANSAWAVCADACHQNHKVGTMEHYNCMRSCPIDDLLGTATVNRTIPESELNRSLFQRITHLMWETSAHPYDVVVEKLVVKDIDVTSVAQGLVGTMISFDNLAEAYLLTITGNLSLEEHLSPTIMRLTDIFDIQLSTVVSLITWLTDTVFDVKLSMFPTTAEVTRLFNMEEISSQNSAYTFNLNTAVCRDGRPCRLAQADTLFALESVGMVDALYPVVKVFNDHKKTHILAKIVAKLFEYYPSGDYIHTMADGSPMPLEYANFRSVEPLLYDALSKTNILADLGETGDILLNLELSDGSKLLDRFADYITYLLTPDENLVNLLGKKSTTDPKGNIIAPLSPIYFYIDAIRDISDVMDAHPEVEDQLSNGLQGLLNVTLKTVEKADGTIVFEKPAGIHLAATAVDFLHTVYLEKTENGTRAEWIHKEIIPDITDIISNRVPYSFFQLFDELDRDNGLENFRKLVLWVMESGSESPKAVTGAAYMLFSWILEQKHLVSVAKMLAKPLDPDYEWHTGAYDDLSLLVTMLTCVNAFNQCDPTGSFNRFFYYLVETSSHKVPNIMRLLQTGQALFRPTPGTHIWCDTACHQSVLDFAYELFTDDDRGVERIYQIIDFTIWGFDRRPSDWTMDDASWKIQY